MRHLLILSLLFFSLLIQTSHVWSQPETGAYEQLVGRWVRPDGGYVLVINAVDDQGRLDAGYFNPNDINVAKAKASVEGDQLNIYVEMQDIGYPGSNYTLTYDKENDRLVGVYYHAVLKKNFEIYFIRQKA